MRKRCACADSIIKHGKLLCMALKSNFLLLILSASTSLGIAHEIKEDRLPLLSYRETIEPKVAHTLYTPDSILEHKEDFRPLYAGGRLRYATCTGVAWFHDTYIAVLNLYGKKLLTYHFDANTFTFTPLQTINQPAAHLVHAENLAFSPDGSLLAVCSDHPHAGVKLYRVNITTHIIDPHPIFSIPAKNLVHNVRFTHDGKYLALAGWDNDAAITIHTINSYNPLALTVAYKKTNNLEAKSKAICFTQDDRYAVIAYAIRVSSNNQKLGRYIINVHEFNSTNGSLGKLVDSLDEPFCVGNVEDITLLPNDTALVLSDQGRDLLTVHPFDPSTGKIDHHYTFVKNPDAQLSFPHGMAVSQDGAFLAVTNYGDDKLNLYTIKKDIS